MSEIDPVCGCDGVTYPNACAAALFDMLIDHEGGCDAIKRCDGPDGSGCDADELCDRAGNCGGEGVCRPRPSSCRRDSRSVCGCDSATYESLCHAAALGVSAAYPGGCIDGPPPSQPCGGPEATTCPPGQFCDVTQAGCDVPDAPGRCLFIPSFCYVFHSPVCSCDGITYENVCFAATAAASLRNPGPCR
jgi:hypothetical protein